MDISSISALLCFRHMLRNSDHIGSSSPFSSKSLLVKKCHMVKTKTDKRTNSPLLFSENDFRMEYIQRHNGLKFISQTRITGKKYKMTSDRIGHYLLVNHLHNVCIWIYYLEVCTFLILFFLMNLIYVFNKKRQCLSFYFCLVLFCVIIDFVNLFLFLWPLRDGKCPGVCENASMIQSIWKCIQIMCNSRYRKWSLSWSLITYLGKNYNWKIWRFWEKVNMYVTWKLETYFLDLRNDLWFSFWENNLP